MRSANRGNARRMARRAKPIVDCCANPPALDRWFAAPFMACNQQHDAVTGVDRLLQCTVDRLPRPVEVMAVEVERAVGLDIARPQSPIPTAVER